MLTTLLLRAVIAFICLHIRWRLCSFEWGYCTCTLTTFLFFVWGYRGKGGGWGREGGWVESRDPVLTHTHIQRHHRPVVALWLRTILPALPKHSALPPSFPVFLCCCYGFLSRSWGSFCCLTAVSWVSRSGSAAPTVCAFLFRAPLVPRLLTQVNVSGVRTTYFTVTIARQVLCYTTIVYRLS